MVILAKDKVRVLKAPVVQSGPYTKSRDWGTAARGPWLAANVQPDRAFEVQSPERETSQERVLVFLPAGTDVDSADRIEVQEVTAASTVRVYEVDGIPMRWNYTSQQHVRVRAWRVEH
ncbi:hypothetical protein ACN20G_23465 [Streptomyces sp. BI20]|uniref:hypothetical protein n=1 Tax=Streptomyces sp. BI20 TaxID=3403460 RepID=UPI003C7826FA